MPKLLAACSVGVAALVDQSETALNTWFVNAKAAGIFRKYGHDVVEGWGSCNQKAKISIRCAWRLMEQVGGTLSLTLQP
jgi:hypothetical protein